MRKLSIITMAVMMIFGSSLAFTTAVAGMNQAGTQQTMGKGALGLFEQVDLTPKQKEKMREIIRQQIMEHEPEMIANREAVYKIITADKFDESTAREVVSKVDKMRIEEMKMHQQMFNLLTPEQKVTFKKRYMIKMDQIKKNMMKKSKAGSQM